jgi:competence protein ComEA
VRLPARRPDDADVIRARLRALLAADQTRGWVPDDDPPDEGPHGDEPPDDELPDRSEPDERDAVPGRPPGVGRHRAPGSSLRIDPGRPGARALWLAALGAVALLVGWTWLDRPVVEPVPPQPVESTAVPRPTSPTTPSVGEVAQTSSTVVVAVVGLVARPGLVTLPAGARVADAVEAAGGLLPEADLASVNLAALVADGQQIAVGVPGAAGPQVSAGDVSRGAGDGPVDINVASAAVLDGLPGIGPVLAQRIVDHRERSGPFRSVEQLADVPGIGPAILAGLADAVTV